MGYLLIIISFLSLNSWSQDLSLINSDGIKSEFKTNGPLVAIGDLHGDYDAFVRLLKLRGLVDSYLQWTGDDTFLVITGDFLDRGPNTRGIMDLMLSMEKQAVRSGGQVEVLLGNHEKMVIFGDYIFAHDNDDIIYEDYEQNNKPFNGLINAVRDKNSKYAHWLGQRNSIIQVNNRIFVHAGVEEWFDGINFNRLNSTIRAWIKFYQGRGIEPPLETHWVMEYIGPLWTYELANTNESNYKYAKITPLDLAAMLKKRGAVGLVAGHARPKDITRQSHPIYGEMFIQIDTGIYKPEGVQSIFDFYETSYSVKYVPTENFCSSIFGT